MKRIFTALLLMFAAFILKAQQDNPYAVFGYKTPKTNYNIVDRDLFTFLNTDTASEIKKLILDTENGYAYTVGRNNEILEKLKVNPSDLLRFLSVDPVTKKYPELTPYQFASNRPCWIKFVCIHFYKKSVSLVKDFRLSPTIFTSLTCAICKKS